MQDENDRQIVEGLKSLSRIDPSAESGRKMQEFWDDKLHRPRRMRIAAIALAAMLLVAVGVTLTVVMSSPAASAAENLRKVAQINESFKGWVHIGSNDPKKLGGGYYYSTIDDSSASVYANGEAHFFDKVTGRTLEYDPDKKTIYIGNIDPVVMSESFEDAAKQLPLAVSIQAIMDFWKQENPKGDYSVRQSTDGKYERYDVDFGYNIKQTLWVDPKTKLLAKMETNGLTNHYWYNDPVIHDIYDLGVPRDAKIVDNRPSGELKEVLDRLDQKIQRGMGDGVAILIKQVFRSDESPGKIGQLEFYGESGKKWAWYQFNVGSWKLSEITGMGSFGPPIEPPAGWPAIREGQPLLSDLANRIASTAFVWDGNAGTHMMEWPINDSHLDIYVDDGDSIESSAREGYGFPGRFTFGSHAFWFYHPTTLGQIVRDDAHRGLIGIDVSYDESSMHSLLWIDPARGDVPIEYSLTKTDSLHHVYRTERIRYLAFQQAANRQWYPQHWAQEIGGANLSAKNTLHENCYLLIDPNASLDAQWFTDPKKHFGPATMPAEPARPTTSATQRSSASAPAE